MNSNHSRSRGCVSIAIPQLAGGGAEKLTANLAKQLAADGLLSRVYTGASAGAERLERIAVVDLAAPRALGAAKRFLRALKGDEAQSFLLTLGYVNLAPILRLARPRARIVLRMGNTVTPELRTLGVAARARYLLSLSLAVRFADQVIVQCDYMGEDLAVHLPHVQGKLESVYNFVEDDLWDYEPPPERPVPEPYLFTAASFKVQKAHDVLLAAYAHSRASGAGMRRLVVAGVAPDDAGYNALMRVNGLGDEDVVRLGFVTDPYRWIAHAEVCVLASRYEGFSNFLLESAALGKRIVATDSPGGNAELISHYPNVVAVPPDDVAALAAALGTARADIPRESARKHMYPFEQSRVYARYKALLLGERPDVGTA